MPKKKTAPALRRRSGHAWSAPFLRALARSGNVRLAARQAGVDHSSAYALRARDVGFAGRWERALAKGRPPSRKASADKGELVLRHSKRCGTQLVKAGAGRWSPKAEAVFFSHLGATGNVRRAAAAAGFSTTAIYKRRLADPGFAARWEAALEHARASLHMMVVGAGMATFEPDPEGEDAPTVTVAEAIAILRLKGTAGAERADRRGGARYGPPEPSIEEVRDEVLQRIAAIRRHREGDSGGEEPAAPAPPPPCGRSPSPANAGEE